jgi:hypothetical protein
MSSSIRPVRTVPLVAALACIAVPGAAAADEPWYNGCDVVPDAPAGYDFTDACNWHDLCIGGHIANHTPQQCDDGFHQFMSDICYYGYGNDTSCHFWSNTYYDGTNQFGECFYYGNFCHGVSTWFQNSWDYWAQGWYYY